MANNLINKNIVFWLDSAGIFFGIASFLQKKQNFSLHAICDITEKQKRFFKEQNFVQFDNTYFFHDYIKKNKTTTDFNYLKSFEEKYGIDLWKLALNDRFFYLYNDFHKFSADEIYSILEQECRLFEEIIDTVNPSYLISMDPSTHHHRIFYELCKAKGIKPLLLTWAKGLGNRIMIAQDATKLEDFDFNTIQYSGKSYSELIEFINSLNIPQIKKKIQKNQFTSKSFLIKAALKFLFANNDNVATHYTYYGRSKLKVLCHKISIELKQKYRQQFIDKRLDNNPHLQTPFVYFPLHMDMEQNPLITAPFFTNQVEIIRHVAKSLPPGYSLYVKEHPHQLLRGWRKISVYKEILEIPNVRLINPSYSSENLVQNCSLIITISGSTGLEGAFYEKQSITFSDVRYDILPSVYRLKNLEELPYAIRNSLQKKTPVEYLDKYITFLQNNSFEVDLVGLFISEANNLYYGGFLADTEIQTSHVQSFFDENKETLEMIAQEYVNIINKTGSVN